MKNTLKHIIFIITLICCITGAFAQEVPINIEEMTKEDVMELTYDQLLEMPLPDLLKLADIVGVSLDELYEMILNKDVVSASKKVESSFEAPLSTSVVSYDEIIASGARTIEEALRLVPGLIVREKTTGNYDVHIRGNDNLPPNHMFLYSENSNSLVMIDGRPIFNYVHGGTFWETLPIGIDDIDRIEVVRGPSSALYGPNALTGVVNIITKTYDDTKPNITGKVEGGTLNSVVTSLRLQQSINNKISFALTGNYTHFDRVTDDLYVFKLGSSISKDSLANAIDNRGYKIFDPADNVNKMFPDPGLGRSSMGTNAYLYFTPNTETNVRLASGYQYSNVLSSSMGDNPMAQVGRLSKTYYIDLDAGLKDLHFKFNLLDGWQDIINQDTGFKVEVLNVNSSIEYDVHLGNLTIRPGVTYQLASYNDEKFLNNQPKGFLNGKRDLNSLAGAIRLDYKLSDLRLIAALRGDKYNTHDDLYFSYQFIASYNINNMHNVRAVVSRANRSPFLVDTYADYLWDRDQRPIPAYMDFQGGDNLDLVTMNMYELGYRIKPSKKLQLDAEFFYTISKNFSALYPDSISVINGLPESYVQLTYQNIDLVAKQMGLTLSGSYIVNQNFVLKAFATIQKTNLEDAIIAPLDNAVETMLYGAGASPYGYITGFNTKTENRVNNATPQAYGGLIANYVFKEKLNINLNTYFMSNQTFDNKNKVYFQDDELKYIAEKIDMSININAKVSYKIANNANVFVNMRNLASNKPEFAYMDDVKFGLLGGVTFNF